MNVQELSMQVPAAGAAGGENVSVSSTSAATDVLGATSVVVLSDVVCFVVKGANPTATVISGAPIPAGIPLRLHGFEATDKLAFITASGTGTVYVRPSV